MKKYVIICLSICLAMFLGSMFEAAMVKSWQDMQKVGAVPRLITAYENTEIWEYKGEIEIVEW